MVNKILETINQFEYETKPEDKVLVKMETLSALKLEIKYLKSVLAARDDRIRNLKKQINGLTKQVLLQNSYPFLDVRI